MFTRNTSACLIAFMTSRVVCEHEASRDVPQSCFWSTVLELASNRKKNKTDDVWTPSLLHLDWISWTVWLVRWSYESQYKCILDEWNTLLFFHPVHTKWNQVIYIILFVLYNDNIFYIHSLTEYSVQCLIWNHYKFISFIKFILN